MIFTGMQKYSPLLIRNSYANEFRSKTFIGLTILNIVLAVIYFKVVSFLKVWLKDLSQVPFLNDFPSQFQIYFELISIWSAALSLYLGSRCIQSDKNARVLDQILSLPMHRNIFIISRIVGTYLLVLTQYLIGISIAIFLFSSKDFSQISFKSIFINLSLYSANYISLISIGILFSFFLSKWLSFLSGLLFWFFCIKAQFSVHNLNFAEVFSSNWNNILLKIIYTLFPRLGYLSQNTKSFINGEYANLGLIPHFAHFLFSYIFLLFIILFAWNKREIK